MNRPFLAALFCFGLCAFAQSVPLSVVSRHVVFDFGAGAGAPYLSPAGEGYVTGFRSTYAFPAPTFSVGATSDPSNTAYVMKLDAANRVAFNVAIGGANTALQIAFDADSNPYVSGRVYTTKFTTTPGAYRTSADSVAQFLCKLKRDTGIPVYCTYVDAFLSTQLHIDSSGAAIFAGSNAVNATATPGALHRGSKIYVGKLNPQGTAMTYVGTFGGSGFDTAQDISVDSTGAITIAGATSSTDFPTTAGAAVATFPGGTTSFVARINPPGTDFEYVTLGRKDESAIYLSQSSDRSVLVSLQNGSVSRIRKYSSDGSAILFDVPVNQLVANLQPRPFAEANGGVLVLGSTFSTNFSQVAGTGWCAFRDASQPAGVLIRFGADGTVVQSTYVPGSVGRSRFEYYSTDGDRITFLEYNSLLPYVNVLSSITLAPASPAASGGAPLISCVGSAATFLGATIAPGEIVTLFGNALAPATPLVLQPSAGRFPLEAAGVDVTFDGVRGALLYVSPTQINAVAPWSLRQDGVSHVCVRNGGVEANCIDVGAAPYSPGIFRSSDGNAAALNQDGTINSASNPAAVGSIVSLYATGLGPVNPMPLDGAVTQLPLPSLAYADMTQVGWELFLKVTQFYPLPISFLGPAPLEVAGLQQINVQVSQSQPMYVIIKLPNGAFAASDMASVWVK